MYKRQELNRVERKLNYGTASEGGAGLGIVPFSQNTNTYYTYGRVDASICLLYTSYKLSADTAIFEALRKQIDYTNQGLKSLRDQISSIASDFAMAGDVIAAIDKVLSLFPGA